LLTGDDGPGRELLLLAVLLAGLAVLLVSYRNALRHEKQGSVPHHDAQETTAAS
jgi:hypothetical protein